MIRAREYRYISPTFKFTSDAHKIMMLTSAGLVHKPNLHLTALAREEATMTDEEQTALCSIANELGLPEDAGAENIIHEIRNLSQMDVDPAKYVPIEAVRDLMKDRDSKVAMARESDVEDTVNDAMNNGYITPGMRNWATSLCRRDPESFAEFIKNAAPAYAHLFKSRLNGKAIPEHKSRTYDEAELAICTQLDIEPGTLLES